jgi:EmrB/QacA subfamily drug resistance transporter
MASQPVTDSSRKWWTLGVVCIGTFMLLLDITIVNVALPSIRKSLHSSFTDLQWVVDAYSLLLASLLLTAGSLSDRLGRQRVFMLGLVVFTVSSVLCGLAGSPLFLNLVRGLQGAGGAMMFATSLALLAQEFHGAERGTAFGVWGATIGGAVAIGPLVGGALTEGLGWESIFFLNLPIGILGLYVTATRLVNVRGQHGKIDWPGLLYFSTGLFMLVFALVRGNDEGWGSQRIVSLLAGAAIALVAFVLIERKREEPMLDLSLFRNPTFGGASIVAFGLSATLFAMFLYMTLWVQGVLGLSPLQAGLRFLPLTLLSFVAAPIAGRLSARVPIRLLLGVGLALVALALALMSGIDANSDWTVLLPGFLIAGVGVGMVNPSLANTAVGVVRPERSGMASGINNTFRQVGIATGVAGLGAIFEHVVRTHVQSGLAGTPAGAHAAEIAKGIASGAGPQALSAVRPQLRATVHHVAASAFATALDELFLLTAAVALVCALLGLALVRRRDFVPAQPTQAPAPAAA